jgi:Uma2 family endonuclease
MSVAVHETEATELLDPHAQLRAFWEELDVPHGWRAEIMKGGVFVTPPPAIIHRSIAAVLNRVMMRSLPDEWDLHQGMAIEVADSGDIFMPDLLVYPNEKLPGTGNTAPAEHALLAVEITSPSNASHDRECKPEAYAQGSVPLYLLVDRLDRDGPHVTLYSMPEDGVYQSMTRAPFGETITLPEPFDLKIDTGTFPRR